MENNMGNDIGMNTYHGETTLGQISTKENNIGANKYQGEQHRELYWGGKIPKRTT
jgi:hypothetical protein